MKHAICVGNNYVGTANELQGCVNDANDWTQMLSSVGYTTMTMTEVGASEVLRELLIAVNHMKFGDRLIFTYSGHGTWVPDRDGDEADGRDEAMYMADGTLLLDDIIQDVFSQLPFGAGALILSDSCFSGTVSKTVHLQPNMMRPAVRFISPTQIMDMSSKRAIALESIPASTPRKTASLISGCGEDEYSYDAWFGQRPNGAFTRVAIDSYRYGDSLAAWYKRIRTTLPSTEYPQSPQLTAQSIYRRYAKAL